MARDLICDICDDDGADWEIDDQPNSEAPVYHRACVKRRAENPNNNREARGMANLLAYGRAISVASHA